MAADQIASQIFSSSFLIALLVGVAVFATIFTIIPSFGGDPLKGRMKAVALERDELRARQRAHWLPKASAAACAKRKSAA